MSEETFLLGPSFKQLWAHKNWAGSPFGTHTFFSDVVEFYIRPKAHCMIWGLYPYNSPSKFRFFPSYLRRKGGILTLMGLLIVNPCFAHVEVQPHVPHYCFWRFVTHEVLIIVLGGFMSFESNSGAPDQRLIFFPFLWAGVSLFNFSLVYKISKGTYSHFLKKHSSVPEHSSTFFCKVFKTPQTFP